MNIPSITRPVLDAARLLRRMARAAVRGRGPGSDELSQMDERGLLDLGIGRGEIPYWLDPQACDERGAGRR